jgi:hypothetical protein
VRKLVTRGEITSVHFFYFERALLQLADLGLAIVENTDRGRDIYPSSMHAVARHALARDYLPTFRARLAAALRRLVDNFWPW